MPLLNTLQIIHCIYFRVVLSRKITSAISTMSMNITELQGEEHLMAVKYLRLHRQTCTTKFIDFDISVEPYLYRQPVRSRDVLYVSVCIHK